MAAMRSMRMMQPQTVHNIVVCWMIFVKSVHIWSPGFPRLASPACNLAGDLMSRVYADSSAHSDLVWAMAQTARGRVVWLTLEATMHARTH